DVQPALGLDRRLGARRIPEIPGALPQRPSAYRAGDGLPGVGGEAATNARGHARGGARLPGARLSAGGNPLQYRRISSLSGASLRAAGMNLNVTACAMSSCRPAMLDGSTSLLGKNSSRSRRAMRSLVPAHSA